MKSLNPSKNYKFDKQTTESSKSKKLPEMPNSGPFQLKRKSSSYLGLSDLDNPILLELYSGKDSDRLSSISLSVQQKLLSQCCSHALFNRLSDDSSQRILRYSISFRNFLTIGLPGGSQSQSLQQNSLVLEDEEISVSPEYEEEIAMGFKKIVQNLENRNGIHILQGDLEAFNQINICSYKRALRFLSANLTPRYTDILMQIVRLRQSQFTVASANSVSILNYASYSFQKQNLRGIFIEGADLRRADLRRTDLSGSKMKRVNLAEARLDSTNLRNCDLREVKFSSLEYADHNSFCVDAIDISSNGRLLVSASRDRSIKIWDLRTMSLIRILTGHSNWVNSVTVSMDGRMFASASSDRSIKLWDLQTFSLIHTFTDGSGAVTSVSFSGDGRMLASASFGRMLRLWDTRTFEDLGSQIAHSASVNSVAFSPDGAMLASCSSDKTVNLWDPRTFSLTCSISGHYDWVMSVRFSPDGKLLAYAIKDRSIRVWNVQTLSLVCNLTGHSDSVNSISFSSDGRLLVSASDDRTAKVWDLRTFSLICSLTGHSKEVRSVSISPDGKLIATSSQDGVLRLFSLKNDNYSIFLSF